MNSDLLKETISNIALNFIPTDDLQILGDILNETICNNASVFSMLVNTNIGIDIIDIQEEQNIQNFLSVLKNTVSAEIKYEAGIEGSNSFFFTNNVAAYFANTVMGAENSNNDAPIGELQLSAFGEIINQFTSKITASLTNYLELKIGALSPAIKQQVDDKIDVSSSMEDKPVILIKYSLNIDNVENGELYQVMSLNLALDVIEKFKEAKIPNYNMLREYSQPPTQNINTSNDSSFSDVSPVTVQSVKFSSFDSLPQVSSDSKNLDLLMDIKLKLTVELGRTEMPIGKVLELARGSVIELDKIAGEPVELYANGKLIANGEVVVIEDNFGLRITNILSPDNRLKNL